VQGGVKHGSDRSPVVIFRTLGVSNAKMAVLPAFAFSIQSEIGGRGAALPAPEPIPYVVRLKNWTQLKGSIINCGGKRWAENTAHSHQISNWIQ